MALSQLELYRGIPIPDANCSWHDKVWSEHLPNSNDFTMAGVLGTRVAGAHFAAHFGTGAAFMVDTAGYPTSFPAYNSLTQCLISDFTPYGLGCQLAGSSGEIVPIWWGVTARVKTPSPTRAGIRATVIGYNAAGVEVVNVGSKEGLDGATDDEQWNLIAHSAAPTIPTTCRHFRMVLHFRLTHDGGGQPIFVDWVGMGIKVNEVVMGTWYGSEFSHSSLNGVLTKSPAWQVAPQMVVQGDGQLGQTMNMNFPLLTDTDKLLLQSAWHWNRGGPTGIIDSGWYPHGSSQPVIAVIGDERKNVLKPAFYADFLNQPTFDNAHRGWFPSTSNRWISAIGLRERLS